MILDFFIFLAIIICFMVLFFIGALLKKDNSIVDIAWGLGVVVAALTSMVYFSNLYTRKVLVTMLATFWGIRLAGFIIIRNRGKGEDYRYKVFRERWGKLFYIKSLVYIFFFQGFLQFILVLPIILVNQSLPTALVISDYIGIFLFLLGFAFEIIADWQMYLFKRKPNNKGILMTTGLWKYSRHPNYFGEILLWWGIGCIAVSIEGGIFTLVSPLLITYLLLFFSGIPLLEKKLKKHPQFKEYQSRTSILIPWFPKKNT